MDTYLLGQENDLVHVGIEAYRHENGGAKRDIPIISDRIKLQTDRLYMKFENSGF